MRTRSISVALLVVALLAGLVGTDARGAGPAAVPAEYADLYAMLAAKLRATDGYITSRWRGERHDTPFAADLLGVRGVKVAVKYPILVPGFPRSAEYLAFFKRLSAELRCGSWPR